MKKILKGKPFWSNLYNSEEGIFKSHFFYLLIFLFVFIGVQKNVFKKDIDINGDNAAYYAGAMSIHRGDGYANILMPERTKMNAFPPGYPFLMSLVMFFSESFIAQKIFNSILLGLSCILLYSIVYKFSKNKLLAFISALLPSLNYLILHFSTMMMSETSFIFFSMISFYSLFKLKISNCFGDILKDPYFYLLLFSSSFAYHIRTQGISLILAFIVFFIIKKDWKHSLSYTIGFIICILPWIIRNKLVGIGSNRYLSQVLAVNHWRPEEGIMSFGGIIERMFSTSGMLISKAIPDSVLPGCTVDYSVGSSVFLWLSGILVVALTIYGFYKLFKGNMWVFLLYIVFSCGIITLWSAPSGNRYLVSIIPLLLLGSFYGFVSLFAVAFNKLLKFHVRQNIFLAVFLLGFIFFSSADVSRVSAENNAKQFPAYSNFFSMAEIIKKKYPKGNVTVCSRKPDLFFLYSGSYSTGFASSLNDTILIRGLIKKHVDFVVLDQLGYSSTYRYLYPAISKNPDLFKVVYRLRNPDTYLLKFNRDVATKGFE